jgi:hypothetical protein
MVPNRDPTTLRVCSIGGHNASGLGVSTVSPPALSARKESVDQTANFEREHSPDGPFSSRRIRQLLGEPTSMRVLVGPPRVLLPAFPCRHDKKRRGIDTQRVTAFGALVFWP